MARYASHVSRTSLNISARVPGSCFVELDIDGNVVYNARHGAPEEARPHRSVVPQLAEGTMSKLTEKVKEEFAAVLPPTIFFFIALHLIALVRVLMLEGTGIKLSTSVSVTIAALVLGKAVVIADLLPIINRFPDKPLAYNIGWKTAVYVAVGLLVHYLERLFDFWRQASGIVAANEKLLAEMVWAHFWGTQIVIALVIFMYCAMREIVRVIGAEKVRHMVLGQPHGAPQTP